MNELLLEGYEVFDGLAWRDNIKRTAIKPAAIKPVKQKIIYFISKLYVKFSLTKKNSYEYLF